MTIFERLELIRAGYKRAEIDAMIEVDKKPVPEPEPEPEPEPQPEPDPTPAPEPESEVSALKKEIAELRKTLQLQNIQKIGLDTPPEERVEDVLAEAIFGNPKSK